MEITRENKKLAAKYRRTSRWYDFLDTYWERQYQKIRPLIVGDIYGNVLEVGVGTGRNLPFYKVGVQITAIDLSPEMLAIAKTRAPLNFNITFMQADATLLTKIPDNQFDWYIATFLFCVIPNHLQLAALDHMARVLKPNGKFRILEITFSKKRIPYLKQKLFSTFVERVYGARFDRQILALIKKHPSLKVTRQSFLKGDTLLLIEGEKIENKGSNY
jgi:ubiquinone/menaquinone biosynthesis C-methylase UbiE